MRTDAFLVLVNFDVYEIAGYVIFILFYFFNKISP